MAENEKNINEEVDELDTIVYTLTDEETGEELDFQLIARDTVDGQLYFALVPADDEECEEYVLLKVTEDGDDILLESIDDDDEFDKVEDHFNDLLFSEVDYDEE